jgi:hypothetical protein
MKLNTRMLGVLMLPAIGVLLVGKHPMNTTSPQGVDGRIVAA